MPIHNAIASLAVTNIHAALRWYESLLRRPADARPMPALAEWKFERGGWLQVYELAARAGGGSCTLSVSNLKEHIEHCESLNIDTTQRSADNRVATVMVTDPDGNHIAFAEAFDGSLAQ